MGKIRASRIQLTDCTLHKTFPCNRETARRCCITAKDAARCAGLRPPQPPVKMLSVQRNSRYIAHRPERLTFYALLHCLFYALYRSKCFKGILVSAPWRRRDKSARTSRSYIKDSRQKLCHSGVVSVTWVIYFLYPITTIRQSWLAAYSATGGYCTVSVYDKSKAPNINKAQRVMAALNAVPIIGTWILSASYLIYSLRQNTCWH